MGNTWGISGPLFLLLFIGALIVTAVGWSQWKRWARRGKAMSGQPASAYELAWLAGGRDRMIDTAAITLLERGQLRISATTKKLSALAVGAQPTEPIESSVWTAVSAQPNYADLAYLHFRLRDDPATATTAAAVVAKGLVVAPQRHRNALRVLRVVYIAIFVVGVVRVGFGLNNHHPVSLLVFALCVSAPIVLIGLAVAFGGVGTLHTRLGDALLAQARGSQPGQSGHQIASFGGGQTASSGMGDQIPPFGQMASFASGAALIVALGGISTYPDPSVRAALMPPIQSGGSSSSSGSSCSTSSSSSSCGGGGGGGCGG